MHIGVRRFIIHIRFFRDPDHICFSCRQQFTISQPGIETFQIGIGDTILLGEIRQILNIRRDGNTLAPLRS